MSRMVNPDSIALAASAEAEGLEAVLVGGNAVNLHSYFRTTFDVDLLVRETDSERWLTYFQQHDYAPFHRTANFIRLRFVADPAGALPVDLMLADTRTFAALQGNSRRCQIGNGLSLSICEDGAALVLPRFDSLPATAGLDNTEAFRLSIRHALALLPALFAQGMDERPDRDYPDRFSID